MIKDMQEAYHTIGKHIYTARLKYGGDKIVVILASTASEAIEKAQEYFGLSCVSVARAQITNDPQVCLM